MREASEFPVVYIWESLVIERRTIHPEKRIKTAKEKRNRAGRDGKKVSCFEIAHFGKALMQSRLRSARSVRFIQRLVVVVVVMVIVFVSAPVWQKPMHSVRHRDCRPALLVSSPLIYCRGIPSESDKRIDGSTREESPRVPRARISAFGMCVFKSVSATVHDTTRDRRRSRDIDWIKNNWVGLRKPFDSRDCMPFATPN